MSATAKKDERKFIRECIKVYHALPALWNIKSKDYNNRIKKNKSYEYLLRKYREKYPDADKQQLVKKFNSLRTNFRKELKRINESERNGVGVDDVEAEPTLWYFEEMKFLWSQKESCTSQNTVRIKEEGEKEDDEFNNTSAINTISHEDGSPKKKSKQCNESLAPKHLQQPLNELEKITSAWAVELHKMEPVQQLFAKKAINDILFEGQMGTLRRDSVQINNLSHASKPHNF